MRPDGDSEAELKNLLCVINIQQARQTKVSANPRERAFADSMLRDAVARVEELRQGHRERGHHDNRT